MKDKVEIHVFRDASERAYGGVVYLRVQHPEQGFLVSLVASCGCIALLKRTTLPRLELLAALLSACLLRKVMESQHLTPYFCYSDSTIVLN